MNLFRYERVEMRRGVYLVNAKKIALDSAWDGRKLVHLFKNFLKNRLMSTAKLPINSKLQMGALLLKNFVKWQNVCHSTTIRMNFLVMLDMLILRVNLKIL